MKKKVELEEEKDHEHEIYKAVAQAWHGRAGNTNPTKEFDAYRSNYKNRPTRFKLEAMSKSSKKEVSGSTNWDFGQSLWDSYEIVTLSKRLESGLVLDQQMQELEDSHRKRRRRESKNSLRNLLHRMSSKRFDDTNSHQEDDPQF